MAAHEDALTREVEDKVALMRRLGVFEMETTSGYVRRMVLGPAPALPPVVAAPPGPPPTEPKPPVLAPIVDADTAKKTATAKKQERGLFGAGK